MDEFVLGEFVQGLLDGLQKQKTFGIIEEFMIAVDTDDVHFNACKGNLLNGKIIAIREVQKLKEPKESGISAVEQVVQEMVEHKLLSGNPYGTA